MVPEWSQDFFPYRFAVQGGELANAFKLVACAGHLALILPLFRFLGQTFISQSSLFKAVFSAMV
jgi:hypothetical protein